MYKFKKWDFLVIILGLMFVNTMLLAQVGQVLSEIKLLSGDPVLKYGNVGLSVRSVGTGKEVISENSSKSMVPASNLKLVTTGAALGILGEEYQFETQIGYRGNIVDSILYGDIIVKGSGDPTFGSDRFSGYPSTNDIMMTWAKKIKGIGIRKINGSICVDASVIDGQTIPDFWPWGDIGNYYGAGLYGLNINENLYKLYFKGNKEGDSTTLVKTVPAIKNTIFVNHVLTGKPGSGDNAYLYTSPLSSYIYMKGTIPAKSERFEVKGAMPNPPLVCGELLKGAMEKEGVLVSGITTVWWTPSAVKVIDKKIDNYLSPPVKEIVKQVNTYSINLFAEALLRACGIKLFQVSTIDQGIKAVQSFWINKGLSIEGLMMYDGSGLSPNNGIPPAMMSLMLCKLAKDSSFNSFYASIPIAGRTGTVYRIGKGTLAEGNIRLKSGTLSKVICYSGYFKSKSGEMFSFSLMSSNYTCSNNVLISKLEKIMVKLVEIP